ncbi:MAG: hypothetical protein P9L94_09350 [Candidatus Hinthialibacter antarcticus]|nr:hypothetical protein [Candidatus Hinthialibacter antarcticus]
MNLSVVTRRNFISSFVAVFALTGCGDPPLLKPEEKKRLKLAIQRCEDAKQTMTQPDKYVAQVAFKVIGDVIGVVDETTNKLPQDRKTEYNTSLLDWRKKVNRLGVFPAEAKESPAYYQALNDALVQSTLLLNILIELE